MRLTHLEDLKIFNSSKASPESNSKTQMEVKGFKEARKGPMKFERFLTTAYLINISQYQLNTKQSYQYCQQTGDLVHY